MGRSTRSQNGVKRSVQRFCRNTDGNIAILFAFMAMALFFFVGGAVDYSRMNAVRADMIESMDAAGLAVARLSISDSSLSDAELTEYGEKFFLENFKHAPAVENLHITFDMSNEAVIAPCVEGQLKTYLLGVVHIDKFDMNTCVEITKKGSGKVELALVLDVTGSMSWSVDGKKKIDSLKDAVDELLQVMYGDNKKSDNIKIGVVPFNLYVNAGGASSWQASWGDLSAQAVYHGARFLHVDENGEVDLSTKVNHYDLFNSIGIDWEGCAEERPYPLDELDVPVGGSITASELAAELDTPPEYSPGGSAEIVRMRTAFQSAPDFTLSTSILTDPDNFRFVPMFYPDEPDCNANWRGRCPSSSGNSYWSRNETFDLGGSNHTQSFWRSWFTDPSYDGKNEGSYFNRHLIDDEKYTGRYAGEPAGRYARIVEEFRALGKTSYGSLSSQQQDWYDFMAALGVNEFYDADITSASDGSTADSDEYILRNAYVGWWDPISDTYKYKYDLGYSTSGGASPNRRCPTEILPLTNNRSAIEDHVAGLYPEGNTNSAIGAMWGWRILSPEPPFTEGVGPSDDDYEDWQKAIVIMTDGHNTVSGASTHWGSELTAYGFAREERMGEGVNSAGEMRNEYDNKLLRICHRMKEQGYLVYTIMFDLDSSAVETMFKACATEPNAPYFYNADNGADLEEAFGNIAADLVDLHISK